MSTKKLLFLFDIDGTLTNSRQRIDKETEAFLHKLNKKHATAIVGGSNMDKLKEQLGVHLLNNLTYCFYENGLMTYKNGKLIQKNDIKKIISRKNLNDFLNWCLRYISNLKIPLKTGTFIELRNGIINVCPVGRNCSQEERIEFYEYDKLNHIREIMVSKMKEEFNHLNFSFSIGGQISIDCFPKGWDKRYCLSFIDQDAFDEIHFFGDKTDPGGNDYEIYNDSRVIGHKVKNHVDTIRIVKIILESINK